MKKPFLIIAGLLLLCVAVLYAQDYKQFDILQVRTMLRVLGTGELEVHGATDFQNGVDVNSGNVTIDTGNLTVTAGNLSVASGSATVADSLILGSGTGVWKILKSGTTLLLITANDTFVVDSVRAK